MKDNKITGKTWFIILLLLIITLFISIPFKVGEPSILGAVVSVSKVYVTGVDTNESCDFNLTEGWNLIGIVCTPNNTSIGSMLSPINGSYASIHRYDTQEDVDKWKSYNPSMPSWVVQDISSISNEKGYWINIDNDTTLNVNGTIALPHKISLVQGWNLIGYPSNVSASPANAFSSIGGSYSIAWTYNTTEDVYLYYDANLGSGTLNEIVAEKGYWINMTASDDLWLT
ncbi:MAG: hypothetical protein U9O94_05670 [Nanoarchaeota archaeon]|nr:hypothetical protein [Nanoarchaeota archaeon]